MRTAGLLAVLGTVSSLFGIMFMTMSRYVDQPSMSINGWAMLFGLACYTVSAFQAMGVARGRWRAGRDAVWPLVWSFAMFALVAWLGAEMLTAILGPFVPGRYPWAPAAIVGVGVGCASAAACLIALRAVLSVIRAGHTFADR